MQDLVKLCATRSAIPTGAALYQICAFVHRVRNTAAADLETFLTLTMRLVTLFVQETTAMTRQSLSSSGTGLVTVTDVQTQEEHPQKIT